MTKAVTNLKLSTMKQNLQTYLHGSLTKIEHISSIFSCPTMPNAKIEPVKKKTFFCPSHLE